MKFSNFFLPIFLPLLAIAVLCSGCTDEKKEHESQLEKIKAYISDKGLTGMTTTESGLSYKITAAGAGSNPVSTSRAYCYYKGYLLDGTVFDEHNRASNPPTPTDFYLNQVIDGWTEGIPKLQKGGKGLFIIPSRLGYKDKAQSTIPANSVLVFEVELVDFTN